MGVTPDRGGLDWGTGPVSLVLALIIAALVGYLAPRPASVAPAAAPLEPALD